MDNIVICHCYLIYLGLSILGISKITMYKYWYDYIKPKYEENARICYMDTDSFIVHMGKQSAFMQTLLKTLKQDLIPQDRYQ